MMRHLAEFNLGVLRHDWDDPRVAEFVENIDRVNAAAERADGFIWRLADDDMEAAQNDACGPLGGNPRTASTLSVWRDASALENFAFNTIHKHFYSRRKLWFEPGQGLRLVLWWVDPGHRPDMIEAVARFRHLEKYGDSDFAFGWKHLRPGQGG